MCAPCGAIHCTVTKCIGECMASADGVKTGGNAAFVPSDVKLADAEAMPRREY